MKKCELESLLKEVIDIADGRTDPYAKDDEKLMRIRDLCARAVGVKEIIPGAFLPRESKISTGTHKTILNLLDWRDRLTDCWGEDLVALLMYEFSGNNYTKAGQRDVPVKYQKALKAFQSLTEKEQYKIVEDFAGI